MKKSDFEDLVKKLNEIRIEEYTDNGHMTLGNLIDEMHKVEDKSLPVLLNFFGEYGMPTDPHSYRGYYSDLSFGVYDPVINKNTVQIFLEELEECLGYTFEGWKGGDYYMHGGTLVWFSQEGTCSGLYPTGVEVLEDVVIIHTSEEVV